MYDPIIITFDYNQAELTAWINPLCRLRPPTMYHVVINGAYAGNLKFSNGWQMEKHPELAEVLGNYVALWWDGAYNR